MLVKKVNLVLSLLLISVFSLSTVFGVPFDDPKPKRLLDNTAAISQLYDSQLGDQDSPPITTRLQYFHTFELNLAVVAENYQNKLRVMFQKQKQVILSITPRVKNTLFYRHKILLSHQQTHNPFILS